MARKLFAVSLVALMLVAFAAPLMTTEACVQGYDPCSSYRCKPKPPPVVKPTIEFLRWERTQSGVRFIYRVCAGSKQVTSWTLFSPVFRRAQLLGTSETPYVYNQKLMYIRFNKPIPAGSCREIWFDLKLNYEGFKLGWLPYEIKAGSSYCGLVRGPLCGSGYTFPG